MKPQYITVSFSGGKDSTAMLLHMMEIGEHIDEVINVDTGMEFPAMYDHIDRVRRIVEGNGIKYTTLRNDKSFEYIMLRQEIRSDKFGTHYGYGWPTPVIRWCTRHMKLDLLKRHFKALREKYEVIECIGLACDEFKRLERPANQQPGHRHPLVEWGWSEADCLEYCQERERHGMEQAIRPIQPRLVLVLPIGTNLGIAQAMDVLSRPMGQTSGVGGLYD